MPSYRSAIKLPFTFDVSEMVKEIHAIPLEEYAELASARIVPGSVNALHLIQPDSAVNPLEEPLFVPTQRLSQLPYLLGILDTFQSRKQTYRIHQLMPAGEIKTHRDVAMSYEHRLFRIHIPVLVNDHSTFILNDESLKMNPGECWYLDVDRVHRVENKGNTPRIHLVIDCERNDWWDDIFAQIGQETQSHGAYDRMGLQELQEMQNQLSGMDNEGSKTILDELSIEIKKRLEGADY